MTDKPPRDFLTKTDLRMSKRTRHKGNSPVCTATWGEDGSCSLPMYSKNMCCGHYQQLKSGRTIGPLRTLQRSREEVLLRDEQGRKKCSLCRTWRSEDNFNIDESRNDGLNGYCKSCAKNMMLKRCYGLTLDDFERLLQSQGNRCAICGSKDPRGRANTTWHVDHDHETGKVRSLLCSQCNTGIGKFLDSPDILRKAADYLENHRAKTS